MGEGTRSFVVVVVAGVGVNNVVGGGGDEADLLEDLGVVVGVAVGVVVEVAVGVELVVVGFRLATSLCNSIVGIIAGVAGVPIGVDGGVNPVDDFNDNDDVDLGAIFGLMKGDVGVPFPLGVDAPPGFEVDGGVFGSDV